MLAGSSNRRKRKLPFKITDLIIFSIIIAVIVILSLTLVRKLGLKHDTAAARPIADKAIADIQKRDGSAARTLGSPTFQKTYTAAQLTTQFKTIEIATLKSPKLDRTIVFDGNKGRTVFFIYKYTALKVPFYIRIGVGEQAGNWKLTQLSGSADESTLIIK